MPFTFNGYTYSMLSVTLMSLVPLVNKFALISMNSMSTSFWNALLAAIIIKIYLLFKKTSTSSPPADLRIFILGILNGLGLLFLFKGLDLMSPVDTSFIARSYLIFSIILAVFILKEKITLERWTIIPLFITGLFLFLYKETGLLAPQGIFLVLASSFCFALNNMLMKKFLSKIPLMHGLFYLNLSSAIFLFISITASGESIQFEWFPVLLCALSALIGSVLGLLFYYKSLEDLPYYMANMFRGIGPLLTFIVTYPFFPRDLSGINLLGMGMILLSILTISLIQYRRQLRQGLV